MTNAYISYCCCMCPQNMIHVLSCPAWNTAAIGRHDEQLTIQLENIESVIKISFDRQWVNREIYWTLSPDSFGNKGK